MALALSCLTLTLLRLGAAWHAIPTPTAPSENAAMRLVASVQENRQIKGMRGIAVLKMVDLASGASKSRRLAVTSALREGSLTMLFVARATAHMPAAALLITHFSGRFASGCLISDPDTVLPLTPARLERPFLETDLMIGDLADDFLAWPSQQEIGREKILGRDCVIIESRPPAGERPAVALVRSWIAPALALPLQVEKYDAGGALTRRIAVERVARLDGRHWGAAVLSVRGANRQTRTEFKMVKADRHADVLPQEFSIDTILKSLNQPAAARSLEGPAA